jgi:hypothetical protein
MCNEPGGEIGQGVLQLLRFRAVHMIRDSPPGIPLELVSESVSTALRGSLAYIIERVSRSGSAELCREGVREAPEDGSLQS